jgi:hypothetical protein
MRCDQARLSDKGPAGRPRYSLELNSTCAATPGNRASATRVIKMHMTCKWYPGSKLGVKSTSDHRLFEGPFSYRHGNMVFL